MSESPANGAGPSERKASASDPDVLRRFVLEYLQQHGYDKVVGSLKEGMTMVDEGEDGGPGKEAIFKASEPVPIEVALKRNIPQAQNFSASTLSDRITPEFETQAKYIIDMVTKKLGGKEADEEPADAPERQDRIMDVSDRVEGYRRYRKWVDNGLDLWKVSPLRSPVIPRGPLTLSPPAGARFPVISHLRVHISGVDATRLRQVR